MTNIVVLALLAGKARPFSRGEDSAIAKSLINEPVSIRFNGLEDDEQADLIHHGGRDKALHHYPFEHYAFWQTAKGDHPLLNDPGAFGENISTMGLLEDKVCIGDRFRLGTALIEISQGRQPCWKQGELMNWKTLPSKMVRERRCGWYYRVIEEGIAQRGDDITLIDRPLPQWTVKRVFALIIGGEHKRDRGALIELAGLELLFLGWRQRAMELAG